jgi:hypothetical protein
MPANTVIKLRRGSSAEWNATNPILASGEPGFDLTNKILKIGNGTDSWNSLSQVTPSGYALLNSPAFTGIPTAPTANSGTNTTQLATTAFVRTEIANLVDSAPNTLDTLNELANALGDDANFAATITNTLSGKASLSGAVFTGSVAINGTGDINTLKINKFYHNNLSISNGISDNDLLLTIVDPTGNASTQMIQGSVLRNSLLNQPAVLRFRQGTNAERLLITPASGEPIWTTDTNSFYIGDGTTVGGDFMGPSPYVPGSGAGSIVSVGNASAVIGVGSVICGGAGHACSGTYSSVVGGLFNSTPGPYSVTCGGLYNTARGTHSIVGAGYQNNAIGIYSVIGGGRFHTNSGTDGIIGGGASNTIGSGTLTSTIGGGQFNSIQASSSNSVIGGGRSNSIRTSIPCGTIGGGRSNTITNSAYYACIAGGRSNTNGGNYNFIGGGGFNACSGIENVIVGGRDNIASTGSSQSTIGGGLGNINNAVYGIIPGGSYSKTFLRGSLAHAAGRFSQTGDAQHMILVARKQTLSGTFTVSIASPAVLTKSSHGLRPGDTIVLTTTGSLPTGLSTNTTYYVITTGFSTNSFRISATPEGTAINTSGTQSGTHSLTVTSGIMNLEELIDTKLIIPPETTWVFTINLSAHNDTNNDGGWWIIRGGIKRDASNNTSLIGSLIIENGTDTNLSSASVSVTANDTNESLQIMVGGVASKNIRWVAVVDISQVSYGTP